MHPKQESIHERSIDVNQKRDLSIVNCIATALLAYFFTIPVHEFFHLLTYMIYGAELKWYSAGAVDAYIESYESMPMFHRIMAAGGSASILNAIIGIILLIILLNVSMGPMPRLCLTQLMGAHLSVGIGYFMIGGFFGAGDWGNVFSYMADAPGVVTALRIILSVIGGLGIVVVFFILNHMSYYFIEDCTNKREKLSVAFKLHLLMLIIGYPVGIIVTLLSPAMKSGELSLGLGLLYNMMWVPFFWGFMFTGVMNVFPPKKSRFLFKLPAKPNWILLIIGIALILVDICIFGPGIKFG